MGRNFPAMTAIEVSAWSRTRRRSRSRPPPSSRTRARHVASSRAHPLFFQVRALSRRARTGRGFAAVSRRSAKGGSRWSNEPGSPRWCPGGRQRTGLSQTPSLTGTNASRAGRPGAIVVEATGIRDVPSGPLLRIGHDRYLDGLSRLVERVKRASGGQTRSCSSRLIDFLAIRRRPEPAENSSSVSCS